MPTVKEQSAGALAGDIGISSPLFPTAWSECGEAQPHRDAVVDMPPEDRRALIDFLESP